MKNFITFFTDLPWYGEAVLAFMIIISVVGVILLLIALVELIIDTPKHINHIRILRNKRRDRF